MLTAMVEVLLAALYPTVFALDPHFHLAAQNFPYLFYLIRMLCVGFRKESKRITRTIQQF